MLTLGDTNTRDDVSTNVIMPSKSEVSVVASVLRTPAENAGYSFSRMRQQTRPGRITTGEAIWLLLQQLNEPQATLDRCLLVVQVRVAFLCALTAWYKMYDDAEVVFLKQLFETWKPVWRQYEPLIFNECFLFKSSMAIRAIFLASSIPLWWCPINGNFNSFNIPAIPDCLSFAAFPTNSLKDTLTLIHFLKIDGSLMPSLSACVFRCFKSQWPHVKNAQVPRSVYFAMNFSACSKQSRNNIPSSTWACVIPVNSVQNADSLGCTSGLTKWWSSAATLHCLTSTTTIGNSMISWGLVCLGVSQVAMKLERS